MDPRANPYNPGAGLRPAALAGRDGDIEAFEIVADRAQRGLRRSQHRVQRVAGCRQDGAAGRARRACARAEVAGGAGRSRAHPASTLLAGAGQRAGECRSAPADLARAGDREGEGRARFDHLVPGCGRRGGCVVGYRADPRAGRQRQPPVRPRRSRRDRRCGGARGPHRHRPVHRRDAGPHRRPDVSGVPVVPSCRSARRCRGS